MAGLFGDILDTGITTAGALQQISSAEEAGQQFLEGSAQIGQQAREDTQFKPFGISSGTGNVQVGADGTIDASLSDQLQGVQDSAFGNVETLFNQAAVAPGARQDEIFQQLMASLRPEQERSRALLAGQEQARGRSGIASNLTGGTPEQFALAKAQEEAQLSALIQARGIGSEEQAQQAAVGSQLLASGLTPEATLFNQLNPAIQTADLGQTGQIAGANLAGQASVAGLEGNINSQKVASDLYGQIYGSIGGLAGNAANSIGGMFGETGNDYADKLLDILF